MTPDGARPLADGVVGGQRRAVSRALSVVERGGQPAEDLLKALLPHAGRAHVVGVTGAPGVGKSTMVDGLALAARGRGQTAGIVAVDPSSPFSGGAILGDRIRMQDATMDPGVFMRSLASRGQTGGLSRSTAASLTVLDAAGFDWIFVETVGAGQSEIEIMALAETVAVVLAPGLGDDIQAIKAGILEIADLFVVNKADRPGADASVRELRAMLRLAAEPPPWTPPILTTVAQDRRGLEEVLDALGSHRAFLEESGTRTDRRAQQVETLVRQAMWEVVAARLAEARRHARWGELLGAVAAGTRDARGLAEQVLAGTEGWADGLH
jgi:LAO/AO transport system kinase